MIYRCMQPYLFLLILGFCLPFQLGCNGGNGQSFSIIRLEMPESKVNSKGFSEPVGTLAVDVSKTCFAVNVMGPSGASSHCNGYSMGIHSQMVKAGGDITLKVSKGLGQSIELLSYELASTTDNCPAWTPADCSQPTMCSVYSAGKVENVEILAAEVVVKITLDMSSLTPVATQGACVNGPVLAVLTSGGNIVDSSGAIIDAAQSNPLVSSISKNGSLLETWDRSGNSSSGLSAPVFVRSITRKPDTSQLFGLVGKNQLVILDGAGNQSPITSCPFETCTVPAWIQSISAGNGNKLFGADASGSLYRITAGGLSKISDLGPVATHFVIH